MNAFLSRRRLAEVETPLSQCLGAYIALKHYLLNDEEWLSYWNILERGIVALFQILNQAPDDDDDPSGGSPCLLTRCTQLYGKHCLR